MSIVWVRKKPGNSGRIDDYGQQSFHTEFWAKSSVPNDTRDNVLADELVPQHGSPHPENSLCVCLSVDAKQDEQHPYIWHIAADWKQNPPGRRDPKDQQKHPQLRRPKWSCQSITIPFVPYIDLTGQLCASSAGQLFDPGVEAFIVCDEITVIRWETACHRLSQRACVDKWNTDTWCAAEPGTALVQSIGVYDEFLQGAYFWNTTYKILVKPRLTGVPLPHGGECAYGGWDPVYIPDVGTCQLVLKDGNATFAPILRVDPDDPDKKWYDGRPAWLDGNGHELPRDPATGIQLSDPVIREFHFKGSFAFSGLGLTPPAGLTFD